MRVEATKSTIIELFDNDIDLMRAIIKLAADQLNDSEVIHMRGSGMPSQAGFCGGELLEIREMIERIGRAVEANITLSDLSIKRYEAPPLDKSQSLIVVEN